jgi:hypothetical protein
VVLSLGIKRPGLEADHSSPSAEVKNEWSYTSTPVFVFTACWNSLAFNHFPYSIPFTRITIELGYNVMKGTEYFVSL